MNRIMVTLILAAAIPVQAAGIFREPVSHEAEQLKHEACLFTTEKYAEHVSKLKMYGGDEKRSLKGTKMIYAQHFKRSWTSGEELFETTISHCVVSKDCSFMIAYSRCVDEVPGYIHEDHLQKINAVRKAAIKRLGAR